MLHKNSSGYCHPVKCITEYRFQLWFQKFSGGDGHVVSCRYLPNAHCDYETAGFAAARWASPPYVRTDCDISAGRYIVTDIETGLGSIQLIVCSAVYVQRPRGTGLRPTVRPAIV